MFGFFKNKFVEANRVDPQREKYLGFGSILISMNKNTEYKPHDEIMLIEDQYKPISTKILADFWDIKNGASARATIDGLIAHGDREEYTDAYVAFKNGDESAIRSDRAAGFKELRTIEKNYKFNLDDVKAGRSLVGWDLERAAFLARLSQHVGFIEQEEAWAYLIQKITPLAKSSFKTWSEYGVSFAEGRTFCYGGESVKGAFGVWTMQTDKKDKSLWYRYPLASL